MIHTANEPNSIDLFFEIACCLESCPSVFNSPFSSQPTGKNELANCALCAHPLALSATCPECGQPIARNLAFRNSAEVAKALKAERAAIRLCWLWNTLLGATILISIVFDVVYGVRGSLALVACVLIVLGGLLAPLSGAFALRAVRAISSSSCQRPSPRSAMWGSAAGAAFPLIFALGQVLLSLRTQPPSFQNGLVLLELFSYPLVFFPAVLSLSFAWIAFVVAVIRDHELVSRCLERAQVQSEKAIRTAVKMLSIAFVLWILVALARVLSLQTWLVQVMFWTIPALVLVGWSTMGEALRCISRSLDTPPIAK
jgi:hypothetical protein